ncbi:hypothetical protein [Cesiribacter andamanensis]|uniref:Uncharacterized protein n=1 Tax=Cesiribacter andamanensis AMV16 TaxID=1279009 RepID=M7P2A1_9BACT|nr:hypothetical protein [Cesiribacter andamanensis]EMR04689.1 hypothetical protein ADICEAN_00141 [Cesiribacter andamanensis AMV16]
MVSDWPYSLISRTSLGRKGVPGMQGNQNKKAAPEEAAFLI